VPGGDVLTLRQAADRLGVHYMTAYGYVRTGRLDARRDGVQWRVDAAAVDKLLTPKPERRTRRADTAPARLTARLLAGDEAGAWRVVERALVSGRDAEAVQLDLLAPALRSIGRRWQRGAVSIAEEHVATTTAQRIVARLGPRFARSGPSRGTVILGCVAGDRHALASAVLADLVRGRGITVIDLGADTPPESFVDAAQRASRLRAVVVGALSTGREPELLATFAALRDAGIDAPCYAGGPGVSGARAARAVGADGWTGHDGRAALAIIDALVDARR
jgi:excisionase family DNA binding protein